MPEPIFTDIGLVNEEIKEILGVPPKWIFRWGSTLLLFFITLCIITSIVVKRPEVITIDAEIFPAQKPLGISVPLNTTIDSIFIRDNQLVKKGDKLIATTTNGIPKTLIAMKSGSVSLQRLSYAGIKIISDTLVLSIIPFDQTYRGLAALPNEALSKIKLGQQVKIELDAYISADFGHLDGVIITKPSTNLKGLTTVGISLENNTTDRGKQLQIEEACKAKVEIVIANRRLIEYLFKR